MQKLQLSIAEGVPARVWLRLFCVKFSYVAENGKKVVKI